MLPNGLDWLGDDPKPPKDGFCPNKDDPIKQKGGSMLESIQE